MRLFQIAVSAAILAAFVLFATGYDPRWLSVQWDDTSAVPFAVDDQLEIATTWRPLKRSSLRLICAKDGAHLMLRSGMPLPGWVHRNLENYERPPVFDRDTHVYLDHYGPRFVGFETRAFTAFAGRGDVDTAVTILLSARQRWKLENWFARGARQRISVHMMETGSYLKAAASAEQVSAFFARCGGAVGG